MATEGSRRSHAGRGFTRRGVLRLVGGGLAWLVAGPRLASAGTYRVGIGKLPDPYAATRRAVAACGEWPAARIAGRTVIIKPNLVVPMAAETGVTTDPEVVRAIVDLALEAGAAQVVIVEGGPDGANFGACGYDGFQSYDGRGSVELVDLNDEALALTDVPSGGMAYTKLYLPESLLTGDVFFISVAKLKTHLCTLATLTLKNLLGLVPCSRYRQPTETWRQALHRRGINQAILDLNLVRPIDFAVVDGMIGMEGIGPVSGEPVELGVVFAGQNAVAVDRACLWAMDLPQHRIQHLTYAACKGLGPAGMDQVEVLGDPFSVRPFAWPTVLPPLLERPTASPIRFAPSVGQLSSIRYSVDTPCWTAVWIVRLSETSPEITVIRTLHGWMNLPAGRETLAWDGRDDSGHVVPPGRYAVQVSAYANRSESSPWAIAWATGWVWVQERATVYIPAVMKTR